MAEKKIIVVGGGLAGLMSTIKAAEQGAHVDLFSIVPVKRSHSVCAQGGINGAVNTKGEEIHRGFTLMILFMVETSWLINHQSKQWLMLHLKSSIC